MSIGEEEITKLGPEISERPTLVDVGFSDRRKEEELQKGTILFRNESYLNVKIDQGAFSALLRQQGLSPDAVNDIEVIFRSATYAHRDFYGRVIGGLHCFEGPIEVYTTLVTDNSRVYETHIPIRCNQIVKHLLHEFAHRVRQKKGEKASRTFLPAVIKSGQRAQVNNVLISLQWNILKNLRIK